MYVYMYVIIVVENNNNEEENNKIISSNLFIINCATSGLRTDSLNSRVSTCEKSYCTTHHLK